MTFRSDVSATLVSAHASDANVVAAARVSTLGEAAEHTLRDGAAAEGLIRYLARFRHGTPFEHNQFQFLIEAPIFVMREFMRHRIGWSYNEESARYRELKPVFYLPAADRPLVQVGKTGHYQFVPGTPEQHDIVTEATKAACVEAYGQYRRMLDAGVAREVARGVLPVSTFSSMYATCNARSLMAFLSLRVHDNNAAYPSYPQREIEMVAEQMEAAFATTMPVTYSAFIDAGRVAP